MPPTDDQIALYNSHQPALTAGYYRVVSSQRFVVDGHALELPPTTLEFSVQAEEYILNPSEVDSVFPPLTALGDFSTILPHIILKRSTLPWERKTNEKAKTLKPWLALLLLTEDELNEPGKVKKINTPVTAWNASPFVPRKSTDEETSVQTLLIEAGFLAAILPTYHELAYLAHVKGQAGSETASVVGSRMPLKDQKNVVHLVSLEGMYNEKGVFIGRLADGYHAFPSLYSWDFFCNDHFIVTPEVLAAFTASGISKQLANALNKIAGLEFFNKADFLRAIGIALPQDWQTPVFSAFEIAHLTSVLKHLNCTPATLRPPETDDLSLAGYLKLPYVLKDSDRVDAVYRGPLTPVAVSGAGPLPARAPVRTGDELFRFLAYAGSEYVDVSYSSAWELGRLLALNSKNFSVALFRWKRECYRLKKTSATALSSPHLSLKASASQYPDLPPFVRLWLADLALLKGVPFNYLVPLESLLPFESLRFFSIDGAWINYLIDGAFSIGRMSPADKATDAELYEKGILPEVAIPKSGFMLRSRAIDGWPNLVVECDGLLQRRDELSENLLFCLYNQQISSLSIHQKPESIHFGFTEKDDASQLRAEYTDKKGASKFVDVNFSPLNKVDIEDLYTNLNTKSVAEFTKLLIQKTEKVTFLIN
jgi:hypothetical protein